MSALFELLNRATEVALDLDPDGREKLGDLEGKVVCVKITAPEIELFLKPSSEGLVIAPEHDATPDVTLTGSLLSFAKLGVAGSGNGVLSSGQVIIEGDVETGQDFQKILGQLDLDWEELLSRFIGDTPARKAGNILRDIGGWARESAELSRENISDYLKEEKRILATPLAMERLEKEVEKVRGDVDRIEQRMNKIRRLLEP
jgi:ubiquinone biosynthesis protein UbiJ